MIIIRRFGLRTGTPSSPSNPLTPINSVDSVPSIISIDSGASFLHRFFFLRRSVVVVYECCVWQSQQIDCYIVLSFKKKETFASFSSIAQREEHYFRKITSEVVVMSFIHSFIRIVPIEAIDGRCTVPVSVEFQAVWVDV